MELRIGAAPMSHVCALEEVHTVSMVFGKDTSAKQVIAEARRVIAAQLEIAQRWADAHGLEVDAESHSATLEDGAVAVFTTWRVRVGVADIDADQSEPGALDRWRWSARVGFWRKLTGGLGREGRRITVREEGLASVTRIREGQGHGYSRDLAEAFNAEHQQQNASGYLPGTGPEEHRPAWLQNDALGGSVGGDWSDT